MSDKYINFKTDMADAVAAKDKKLQEELKNI